MFRKLTHCLSTKAFRDRVADEGTLVNGLITMNCKRKNKTLTKKITSAMTLIKFKNDRLNNPSFNDIIDDFFNREVPTMFRPLTNQTLPAVNVAETKDGYRLEMALSGWNQNDVNINLEGNLLSISGEHQTKQNEDVEQYTRREFSRSSFSRTFTLPETVDAERIAADFQNGLLVINVPKREEAKKKGPKTIQIGSNKSSNDGNA